MSAKCGFTPLKHWTLGTKQDEFRRLVPKEGFEPTHPYGYYVLNVARLPFRHFGIFTSVVPIHHILTGYLVGDRGLEPLTSCV